MIRRFVEPLRAEVGRAIYVWGRVGEAVPNEDWVRRYETSPENAAKAIELLRKLREAGVDPVRAFDCSGFIVWILRILGITTIRYTADMFSNICPTIPKAELRVGDFVFNLNSDGNAYHVGIVSRIEAGVTYVVESRGRAYGVIERPLSSGTWDDYSHNPFIDTSEENNDMKKGDSDASTGGAVTLWQQNLLDAGFKMVNDAGVEKPVDGDFGGATENGTELFQAAFGLTVTGIVDNLTWAAMVGYQKERATYLASENAECQKVVTDVKAQLVIQTGQTDTERAGRILAENAAAKQKAAYAEQDLLVAKIRAGRDATDKL